MRRSTKTAYAGGAAGLALVVGAFSGETFEPVRHGLQILAGLALIALGVWARDDDVTSEGAKAPKYAKRGDRKPPSPL